MARQLTHYGILIAYPEEISSDIEGIKHSIENINNEMVADIQFDVVLREQLSLRKHDEVKPMITEAAAEKVDLAIVLFTKEYEAVVTDYNLMISERMGLVLGKRHEVFVCVVERKDEQNDKKEEITFVEGALESESVNLNSDYYITYTTNEELQHRIDCCLELYLDLSKRKAKTDYRVISRIPFSFQEYQNDAGAISSAKSVVFIARTGKIFLNGYYNQLRTMLLKGGHLSFVTSKSFNVVYEDHDEHKHNNENSLALLKRLHQLSPTAVSCYVIDKPVNLSMVHIVDSRGYEVIKVKFNFQAKSHEMHPMFILEESEPFFNIFKNELVCLQRMASSVSLS